MQDYDLPYPGYDQLGETLRRVAAKTISNAENDAVPDPRLAAFLLGAAQASPGYVPPEQVLPANSAVVSTGAAAVVRATDGRDTGTTGVVEVVANELRGVRLPDAAAVVTTGLSVAVKNSTGGVTVGAPVQVVTNAVSQIKLPATTALVQSGAVSVAATGSGTKVTLTVADGVITAVTLSA